MTQENRFKHRIVGAIVLVALVIIFVPMLFNQELESEQLSQDLLTPAPMPPIPAEPDFVVTGVEVPEPVAVDIPEPLAAQTVDEIAVEPEPMVEPVGEPEVMTEPEQAAEQQTAKPALEPKPEPQEVAAPADSKPGVDENILPVTWSVQIASTSNPASANKLRDEYRVKGYKAYTRPDGNTFKVLFGPFQRKADAVAECNRIKQREGNKQACFVTRYQP